MNSESPSVGICHVRQLGCFRLRRTVIVCACVVMTSIAAGRYSVSGEPSHLPRENPRTLGVDEASLQRIAPLVDEWRRRGEMAGCVVAIGFRRRIVYLRAFGHRALKPRPVPMTTDTVFDMASLTKPVATATSIVKLIDEGKLRLDDRVAKYLPDFGNHGKEAITVYDLLTHQSGLTPDNSLGDYRHGSEEARRRVMQLSVLSPPGEKFRYSDVGFIVLGWLVEKITGKRLDRYVKQNVFGPLHMSDTGFLPSEKLRARAAVTEQRDGRWMQGEVHDPRSFLLGGVAGHAGLFSTAEDLAVYAQMMLEQGTLAGVRVLSPRAVATMTSAYPVSSGKRGLGWDKQTGYSSNRGEWMTSSAFGHGGFTGTSMWIDPQLDLFVIFLSNRLHPDGRGSVNRLAGRIGTLAAAAVPRRPENARSAKAARGFTEVLTGIDVLQANGMDVLRGRRVGLITNQTGINCFGESTSSILHAARDVRLVSLFSPEHGIAGKLDIPRITDSREEETGLAIHSLYGKTRQPTEETLAGIDTLVFDIQDIGCRFYTYISTMGLAMEAAAKHGKRFVVLDRPNPLGGVAVGGPMLDAGRESFVAFHRLPVRHGMTIGELARLFKDERKLRLDLVVVPMRGWQRTMMFDHTGQIWVNPSPNMRSLNAAILYPGIGLLETTNISVGRGTDTPFEVLGAPWLDAREMVRDLSMKGLGGVTLTPIRFTPDSSKYANEPCRGVRFTIANRQGVDPLRLGFQVAVWLRQHHRDEWQSGNYLRLLGNERVFQMLQSGASADVIESAYRPEVQAFEKASQKYFLYR